MEDTVQVNKESENELAFMTNKIKETENICNDKLRANKNIIDQKDGAIEHRNQEILKLKQNKEELVSELITS